VQPLVLNEDSTVGVDELKMNVYGFIFPHRYKEKVLNESKEIQFFSGAGFIINISKFFQIGDFDENYFMYYEDADYAVRCSLAGDKMFLTDSVKIIHYYKNSVSSSRKMKQLLKSRKIFVNKYFTDAWRLLLFVPDFQNSRDSISREEKNIFTKQIIKKTLNGFKTRQVPFLIRITFNVTMFLYSIVMKIFVSAFLSTENNKSNELR
jgi:GT2 family glycosyltransferase